MGDLQLTTNLMRNSFVWVSPSEKALTSCIAWKKGAVEKVVAPKNAGGEWEFSIQIDDGNTQTIRTVALDTYNNDFELVKPRDEYMSLASTKGLNDMTGLTYLNEPSIIECLRLRYIMKRIYTNTGPILIAINPCESLSIYTPEEVNTFYSNGLSHERQDLNPHVYEVGDRAYRRMFVDPYDPNMRENQTILVSGESGAGKTVSMKHILHYLAVVSSTVSTEIGTETLTSDIESQIVASNPINESFGNAKTSRNGNSSRFGKFTELRYSAEGCIESANIKTYLLETVRVPRQTAGERNFHIFYEIFAGLTSRQKADFGLTAPKAFNYLNQTNTFDRGDGESDTANFDKLREAWGTLDIPNKLQDELLKIVVGILHLGNIEFVHVEGIGEDFVDFHPSCVWNVKLVHKLLGIPPEDLLLTLTKRSINVMGTDIAKNLSYNQAITTRDSFAQEVYLRLFNWMMTQINDVISGGRTHEEENSASFIGLLDIFGFEFFEKNSFEQLCINYTNEKLQDHFNFAIFKSEQEVYQNEGLKWVFVQYPDNFARLELLENRTIGIYALCDEQLKMPKCTDEKFAKSLYDKCGKHKYFSASKAEQMKCEFVVKHFACDVKYQAEGFLDKNRSDVAKELMDCLSSSKSVMVRQICPPGSSHNLTLRSSKKVTDTLKKFTLSNTQHPKAFSVRKSNSTVSKRFSKELKDLMEKIRTTRSHFIRCIKPNAGLKPGVFDESMVIQQLRCGGTLSAIQVFRAGFTHRMEFKKFALRFVGLWFPASKNLMVLDLLHIINRAKISGSILAWRAAVSKIMDIAPISDIMIDAIQSQKQVATLLNPGCTAIPAHIIEIYKGTEMGNTMIFMKAELYEHLEGLNNRVRNLLVLKIQKRWKRIKRIRRSIVNLNLKDKLRKPMQKASFYILHRVDMTRDKAKTIINATVRLQRQARLFLDMCRRKRAIRAVNLMKALYRGWLARMLVKSIKNNAARRIQAIYRRYRLQKVFIFLRRCVVLNQRVARRWLKKTAATREAARAKKGLWSVICLQAAYRGWKVRMSMRGVVPTLKTPRSKMLTKNISRKSDRPLMRQTSKIDKSCTLGGAVTGAALASYFNRSTPRSGAFFGEDDEKQLSSLEERLKEMEQERDGTKVKALEEKIKQLEEELKNSWSEPETMSAVEEKPAMRRNKEGVEHTPYEKELEASRALVTALRAQLAASENDASSAKANLSLLQADLETAVEDREEAEKELMETMKNCPKCDEFTKRIAELEAQLEAMEEARATDAEEAEGVITALQGQITAIEEDNTAKVAALEKQLMELEGTKKTEAELATQLLDEMEAHVKELEAKSADGGKAAATIVALRVDLNDAEKLVEDLQAQIQQSEIEKKQETEETSALIEELSIQLKTLEGKAVELDKANQVIETLENQLTALEEEKELEGKESIELIESLQQQVKELEMKDKEQESETVLTLRQQIAALDTDVIEVLRKQIEEIEQEKMSENEEMNEILEAMKTQMIELEKNKNAEVDEATEIIEDLQEKLNAMQQERDDAVNEAEELKEELEIVKAQAAAVEEDRRVSIEEVEEATEIVETVRAQLSAMEEERNSARADADDAIDQLEQYKTGEQKIAQDLLKAEIQFLTEQLVVAKKENNQLKNTISILTAQLEALEDLDSSTLPAITAVKIDSLTTETKLLRDHLESSRKELSRLKTSSELELQSSEQLRQESQETIAELKQKIAKLQATNKVLDDKVRQSQKNHKKDDESEILRNRLLQNEKKLDLISKELDILKTENATLKSNVNILTEQNKELIENMPTSPQHQKSQVTMLLARVQALDAARAQLDAEVSNANTKLADQIQRIRDAEKDALRYSDAMTSRDKEISSLRSNAMKLEQTLAAQKAQIASCQVTEESLNKRIENLTKKLKKSETDYEEAKKDVRELLNRVVEGNRGTDKSKAELLTAQKIIERLQKRIARMSLAMKRDEEEEPTPDTILTNRDVELLLTCGEWDANSHSFNTNLLKYADPLEDDESLDESVSYMDAVEQIAVMQADVAAITNALRKSVTEKQALLGSDTDSEDSQGLGE